MQTNLIQSVVEVLPALSGEAELLHVVSNELLLRQGAAGILLHEGFVPEKEVRKKSGRRTAWGTIPQFVSWGLSNRGKNEG
jgi:hypothetical protein